MLIVSAFAVDASGDVTRSAAFQKTAGLWSRSRRLAVLLAGSDFTRRTRAIRCCSSGLAAFAIMFLGYQWMSRTVRDAAWAQAQASAIVNACLPVRRRTRRWSGIYLGSVAAITLVLFGLTSSSKRVPSAYAY